ncbi:MAG: choice-of-anchor D domain-containing protein [Bryobacteraceae bacterium]
MTHRLRGSTVLLVLLVCCCSIAQPQSCTPAPPGLVSWWTGDTNENDIVGGNNPLAVQAVTLVPGEVENGFTFGKDGYIQIPDAANLANQTFTWLAWAMPAGPGPNNDFYGSVIVEKNIDDVDESVSLTWSALSGEFLFTFGNDQSETIASTDTFQAGSFYFVAATYDGSTFRLFVNGLPEGSFSESKTVSYNSSDWEIGSSIYISAGYPRTWNGIIDEVQAYNVALSQSEIQAIYNAGAAGVCKGLTFSPASLRFPRQTIGATSPAKTVTATNAFPLPVTVKKVATSGDFAQTNTCPVPPAQLATGATCTASVTFTPTATGTRTGKLTFNDSAPATPQRVHLTGSATDISLSVSRLGFASRKVGTTSRAKSVTVTNDGTVSVNFTGSGILIAGTDPADFIVSANTCGPSIAAGGTCTVSVEFKPMATGTRTAALQFNDDGGASPQTVTLTGTGT